MSVHPSFGSQVMITVRVKQEITVVRQLSVINDRDTGRCQWRDDYSRFRSDGTSGIGILTGYHIDWDSDISTARYSCISVYEAQIDALRC